MPFRNTSEYLGACIRSIQDQTFDDWELIAIDDHSTDDSLKVVQSYAESDRRINVLPNNGRGIIQALREAYMNSSGECITRMDSDDIMEADKLKVLHGNLTESGMGHVAVGQVKYFSEIGISDGYARYEKWINRLTAKGLNYTEIYKECVIPSPCWMVFRQDLERVGAFEPDRYPEDYDLTFRFYKGGIKCIPCNQVLHNWRDYPHRTSRTSEHYAQNYFLDIKIHYFMELDRDPLRPLVIWGAGTKGKTIAQYLINHGQEFFWLCDNPNKIGKKIYEQEMHPFQLMEELDKPQSIITVANEKSQADIRKYFDSLGMQPMTDYYFFC